ncbi:flavin reductase [Ancylobacter vacuolatus]|uniref:Flavin reductase (DIM6/NTAB) family NADH-FMN oxidoreductase RutF n=1 Tax=Ancylobacter vacuolatus TaxID=223389 RepID=A0ABU0DNP7_9HYPH|nr:flavin reductase [Ancylobacter vacuolatus]MDQ0350073.1 flavin reductase (DIM6/NTAB) family NADH-FMN oxidoreductase RutF [Ancylobacter vacuolatus]
MDQPKAHDAAQHDAAHAVEAGLYREAMSRLVAAVHVITTHGPDGRAGFTATAVASVSDSPPTLLVCLNRRIRSAPAFRQSGRFAVNMLGADQQSVAESFGGRGGLEGEARFGVGHWHEGALGLPCLTGAIAVFQCRMVELRTIATHDVLVGRVEAVALGPDKAKLAYLGRGFLSV